MDGVTNSSPAGLQLDRIKREFPEENGCLYLNTGSCGRKPQSVLNAINEGWRNLNVNPTYSTFLDEKPLADAKSAASKLFSVDPRNLLLTQNTTQGLHFLMSSFLRNAGDVLVTTHSEHGSVKTIAEYLAATRGIQINRVEVDPQLGSDEVKRAIFGCITSRTKLVLVSEISSYTSFRPDLYELEMSLRGRRIPLLVDGAHAPGQIICRPENYRLWVGSGHKWLGGPNGTGFCYVAPDLVPQLEPLWLGDEYYQLRDAHPKRLAQFESQGTSDLVRWRGLEAAINLQLELGPENIYAREVELANYLRKSVAKLNPTFRVPADAQNCALVSMHWNESALSVPHVRDYLWEQHKIWVQPDYGNENPGLGVRVSCHYSLAESDLEIFVAALAQVVKP